MSHGRGTTASHPLMTCGGGQVSAGLVTAHLRVKQGCIQAVRFYGDFFGSGPLEELEAAMAGLPLDAQLAEALAPLHVEHYMSGITAEELARLLRG